MDLIDQKPLLLLIFLSCVSKIAQSGFNAAYLKKTNASYTCGSPPEEFFETQQGFLSAVDRVPFICNASDPTKAYPPENMVDGLLGTHWQCKAGQDMASITISFEQALFAQDIYITFGNYRRPGAMMVEKSTDFGRTFTPWHYFVTTTSQCTSKFGVATQSNIHRVDQVLCSTYKLYVPPEYNETIFIKLDQKTRENFNTLGFQSWMNATAVRFRFLSLYRKFDSMAIKWHHYTVREIAVTGRCDCKGHADGNHCPLNQSTGLRACQCQGNTCGVFCDQCCPLYNQFPWKPGSGVPWTNDPAANCEPCNCHNHTDTCTYNQTVSNLGLSMTINGSMIGGGVCVNCQHHTQGLNCEKCKDYFYRPLGRNQSNVDSCQACSCNLNGTTNAPVLSFGDCVRDQSVLSAHPGKQPGDCYCKEYVQGRQCDTCKVGNYRLTQGTPQGCIACNCHPEGTKLNTSCEGDYYGQCDCKANVELRNCSQCKDGYYELQASDINGCKSCNCDVGATRSDQKCDKVTGVCYCYPHVIGRTCDRAESGFYYPDVHFIQATRNPYKSAYVAHTLHVLLNIPKTGNYRLQVQYTNNGVEAQAQAVVQYRNISASGPQADELFNISLDLSNCERSCPTRSNKQLKKGHWMINITTTEVYEQLNLDRVIAIPEEFIKGTVLGAQRLTYRAKCDIDSNNIDSDPDCVSWFFSVTMDYLHGALACDCHPLGSMNSICESYGGQCACKHEVEGRDCGRCKPRFYNLTATGCTPCGCNGRQNQICDVMTGMCECPQNTVGRTCLPCQCNNNTNKCLRTGECLDCQFNTTGFSCQHCDNGTFGNAQNRQCTACTCNEVGSLNQQCDRVSGQCNCRTKVTERNCSVCQNNAFDFGVAGCRDCECNPFGSASLQCSLSGQCSCQSNVTGLKCTQCTLGFYGLPVMSCRGCNCNTTGTIPNTTCTNDTAGQCHCKPGVTGRSCDQCMKYFTNFSDTGCAECSPCVQKLRDTIVNTTNNANVTKVKILGLEDLAYFNAPLVGTSGLLQQAKVEREQFYARIAEGNRVFQELITSNVPKTNDSLKELSNRAWNLSNLSRDAVENTTGILEDVKNGKQSTLFARQYVTSVYDLIQDVLTALNEYNAAAVQDLTDSTDALHLTRDRNFSQYSLNITDITHMTENASANVEDTLRRVYSQLFGARELEVSVEMRAANFIKIQDAWNQSHAQFMDTIEQVYNHSREIHTILMETKNLLDEELLALNMTQSSLSDTNTTLMDTQNAVMQGTSILEDLSQINGLTNVSNLLETEIGKIKQKLGVAEDRLQQAQNQASYLASLAQQMEQTFNRSLPRGSLALSAIDRYSGIQELVDRSLGLVEQANSTVYNITNKLSVVSLNDLKHNAEMTWQSLYELYNVTLERNITAYNLENIIYEANATFLDSLAVWSEIYEKFPAIQNAAGRFQAAASKAPDVVPSLMVAKSEVINASLLLTGLEARLRQMEHVIDVLLKKTTAIRNSSNNGITMINDTFVNVQNITARLTPNPDEPPVNVTVREATATMASLPPIRQQIEIHIDNTTDKLKQIRSMVTSIPLALHLVNGSSITLVRSIGTIESPYTNEISFDVKTNSSEGMLLYMVGEQHNLTVGHFSELENSLGFYISNSLVHVVFHLGDGPITAQNPLKLKNDTWYNIYFTRSEATGSLTVSADPHRRKTVTMNGSSVGGNKMLQLTNQSAIYLGGLAANLTESQVLNYFNGIIDNLVIDNTRYNLWKPNQVHGDGRLYALPRYKGMFYPPNGRAASFHGNGYIQHALGHFNGSLGYTAVEVDFRTLYQNGIIMALSNEQRKYVFVIYLENGHVNFYFEPGRNDAITLKSTRSSYGNGRWYRIRVVRTSVNATLTVNPVGSRETPDSRFVDTGATVMESGYLIFFGALNPNSLTSFAVTDVFSGDMNNLLLFSDKSATLISRNFNDAVLMIAKQGVSFGGVIRGPIEYGTRFYGYREEAGQCSHASVDVSSDIGAVTSLAFTFQTKKESGVLLYSGNDGIPLLYLTLLHGDLQLWMGDIQPSLVFSSSNITFSDNSWHVFRLASSGNGYSLHVNETGIFDFAASPLVLSKPFYMGGVPRDMSLHVPYALCFKGGMKNLVINLRSVSFFSGHTIGVSSAGVIPARVPLSTCSASLHAPTSSNNEGLHFDLLGSKGQGYVGFNLTLDQRSAIFSDRFLVGLIFRALSDDGLLLYGTDNDTHPTQFFSLELVGGRLVYKFDSGGGLVSITSDDKYSGKGHRYKVYIIRQFKFGAMLVDTTGDYAKGKHDPPSYVMKLTQLYIAGIPNHVVAPHLTNRYLGFVGCISDFKVKPNKPSFNLTTLDQIGPGMSGGSCYSTAQPGLGFNGFAWARFDNFTLTENFSVQLTFRTSSRDGLLFLILGNSTSEAGNRMHVRLEQSSGQIVLTYNTTANESRVVWTEPGLGNNSESSYLMCQMKWHTIRVTKQGPNIIITLDEQHYIDGTVAHGAHMSGELFLGGYPAKWPGGNHTISTGFQGCLKSFSSDGNSLHFARAANLSQVSFACPLSNTERKSAINSEPMA